MLIGAILVVHAIRIGRVTIITSAIIIEVSSRDGVVMYLSPMKQIMLVF